MRAPALRLLLDPYLLALAGTVLLASLLPVRGDAATAFGMLTKVAIAALFFLYGARLSREAITAGLVHWRLHAIVLATTFVVFPLLGLGLGAIAPTLLSPSLHAGVLFLCALPSTVQSSIAFTAIARGNVAAAVCSASLSNLLGVFLTPLLVSAMLVAGPGTFASPDALGRIVLQLFVPFVAGHLLRPWLAGALEQRRRLLAVTDRGSVVLVVYAAFSAAVIDGLWQRAAPGELAVLAILVAALLAIVLGATTLTSRRLGFSRADGIAIVFCGSNKSLASGVPIASILFAGDPALGMILLPVMLYHPLQLVACAAIAQQQARRPIDA